MDDEILYFAEQVIKAFEPRFPYDTVRIPVPNGVIPKEGDLIDITYLDYPPKRLRVVSVRDGVVTLTLP